MDNVIVVTGNSTSSLIGDEVVFENVLLKIMLLDKGKI